MWKSKWILFVFLNPHNVPQRWRVSFGVARHYCESLKFNSYKQNASEACCMQSHRLHGSSNYYNSGNQWKSPFGAKSTWILNGFIKFVGNRSCETLWPITANSFQLMSILASSESSFQNLIILKWYSAWEKLRLACLCKCTESYMY